MSAKSEFVNLRKDYVKTIDATIGFAIVSLVFIWTMILGPVYNHYYPDSKIYYLILFQTLVFITDILTLTLLPIINRRYSVHIFGKSHYYNRSWSVIVSLISLYSIGLAVILGGWIWRLVLYNNCLNLPDTDPCRTGSNGDTALVLLLFDVLDIVPIIGAIITLSFSHRFLKSLHSKKSEDPDNPKENSHDKGHKRTRKGKKEHKREEEEEEESESEDDSDKSENEESTESARSKLPNMNGYMPKKNVRTTTDKSLFWD